VVSIGRKETKIIGPVVRGPLVDVIHDLLRTEIPEQQGFGKESMFGNVPRRMAAMGMERRPN
jgi:hypothetical protein